MTGVDWPEVEQTGISGQDAWDLVVVVDGESVVSWAMVDRFRGVRAVGVEDGCRSDRP